MILGLYAIHYKRIEWFIKTVRNGLKSMVGYIPKGVVTFSEKKGAETFLKK